MDEVVLNSFLVKLLDTFDGYFNLRLKKSDE